MHTQNKEFDAIVVGSGPGGAAVARELSRKNKSVLILERGGNAPLKEGFVATASILDAVSVGDNMPAASALTTGGTTAVYFAVADFPPLETFRALGIDLSAALEEATRELPLTELPDALLGAQALKVRESALQLGYPWIKRTMLVDLAKCASGYAYDAKWTARSYVEEAVANGATLVNRARVLKVLVDDRKRAIGVEYRVRVSKKEFEIRRAFGSKVVLAAGATASPAILRDSGIRNIGNRGFHCQPSFVVFGSVPGLKAGETFAASEGADFEEEGVFVGDANLARTLYRMFMLRSGRLIRAFSHSRSVGVGVMVRDEAGGGIQEDGRYFKQLKQEDLRKLEKGEQMARQIIANAGGKNVFKTPLSAARVGGVIRVNEHLDAKLQTEYENLHVCDGSVIPGDLKISPTLPLVCLGKYLAGHLSQAL